MIKIIIWSFGTGVFGSMVQVGSNIDMLVTGTAKPSYSIGLRYLADIGQLLNIRFDIASAEDGLYSFKVESL